MKTMTNKVYSLLEDAFPTSSITVRITYFTLFCLSILGFMYFLFFSDSGDTVSNIGSWASTVSLIPITVAGYNYLYGRPAEIRRNLKRATQCDHAKEGVFIIDLKYNESVQSQFEKDKERLGLKNIPTSNIVPYNWEEARFVKADDLPKIFTKIEELYESMVKGGVQKIHLFYAGPVVIGPMLGDLLSNQVEVILYEYNKGEYNKWAPLNLR